MIRQLSLIPGMLALAALLVLGQLPASAQANGNQGGQGGPRNRAGMDVRNFSVQLNLTDEQLSKINDIIKAQNQDITNALTPEQQQTLKDQLAVQQLNVMQRVGAIKLTDEQQPKVQAIRDAMMQEMRDMMQNGGGAQGTNPNTLQVKYSKQILALLTPEQTKALSSDFTVAYTKLQATPMLMRALNQDLQTKINGILQDKTKQADAIRDDATLKDDEKLAKMNDLNDKTLKLILDVLTPDQQTQMKSYLASQNQVQQINLRTLMALNLTDDQQTKVRAITQKSQQDIMQVLTADQQQKLQELRPRRNRQQQPQQNG